MNAVTPQLDHYIGRPVTQVSKNKNGWYIGLAGDISIICEDLSIDKPDLPEGFGFLNCDKDNNQLIFGLLDTSGNLVEQRLVTFNFDQYKIKDSNYDDFAFVPVSRDEIDLETPPFPSERVVEAPMAVEDPDA
jgi:hypothetical protein